MEGDKRTQGHMDKPIYDDKLLRKTPVGLSFHLFPSEDTIHLNYADKACWETHTVTSSNACTPVEFMFRKHQQANLISLQNELLEMKKLI